MSLPYGLTAGGFVPPRAFDLLAVIRGAFERETNGGAPYDWDADTWLGVLTAIQAVQLGDMAEGPVQALADALDINNASGALLDQAVQSYGLSRRPATQGTATLTATLSSTPVFIPAGTRFGQVFSATEVLVWAAVEDTTLVTTGDEILVRCAQPGVFPAGIGAINRVLDRVTGLVSVTNPAAASPGLAEQADRELRLDALRLLQAPSRGTVGALYAAAVRAVPAGTFVGVLENRTPSNTTVDGVAVPAIGATVVIHPQLAAAEEQALRESIYAVKPLGGSIGGSEVGAVIGPDGGSNSIGFEYANTLTVNVAATVTMEAGFVLGDVSGGVEDAIEYHFTTLRVGDDVLRLDLLSEIAKVDGVRTCSLLLNGANADVTVGAATIAILGTPTVS